MNLMSAVGMDPTDLVDARGAKQRTFFETLCALHLGIRLEVLPGNALCKRWRCTFNPESRGFTTVLVMPQGVFGHGITSEEAVEDFAAQLEGMTLTAHAEGYRDVVFPKVGFEKDWDVLKTVVALEAEWRKRRPKW